MMLMCVPLSITIARHPCNYITDAYRHYVRSNIFVPQHRVLRAYCAHLPDGMEAHRPSTHSFQKADMPCHLEGLPTLQGWKVIVEKEVVAPSNCSRKKFNFYFFHRFIYRYQIAVLSFLSDKLPTKEYLYTFCHTTTHTYHDARTSFPGETRLQGHVPCARKDQSCQPESFVPWQGMCRETIGR